MVTLTADEVQRYKRHLVLRDVGAPGQQKLKAARVLVVGAGGLGSPVLMYLAAAGVGTIGIIDDDRVAIDNLQRQIVHREADVGPAEGRERAGRDRAHQPSRQCRDIRRAPRFPERARHHRPVRHRSRRNGQLRNALSRFRRLLSGETAAGLCRARIVRRLRVALQAARERC